MGQGVAIKCPVRFLVEHSKNHGHAYLELFLEPGMRHLQPLLVLQCTLFR
jgi:hypothetical protein